MKIKAGYVLALIAGYLIGSQSRRRSELAAGISLRSEVPGSSTGSGHSTDWPDIKEHVLEQLPRIAFLTVFWIILAIISMILILNNVVEPHETAPGWLENYLDERLNIYIPLFEICIYIFLTGIAAIVGSRAFVSLSQEEICRFFYNMSAFVSLLSITLLCFFHHFNTRAVSWDDYVFSVLIYVEGVFVGLFLSWLFKYRSLRDSAK